jgi:hypothetical protein
MHSALSSLIDTIKKAIRQQTNGFQIIYENPILSLHVQRSSLFDHAQLQM